MTLFDLNLGERAIITKVKGRGAFRKRIIEMGFIVGKEIIVVKKAPFKDPVEYNIMGYNVSLRNTEAKLVEVISDKKIKELKKIDYSGVIDDELFQKAATRRGKNINIAFVGNPNSGKTTLFNFASGSRERVGNYSGVTVDAKEAKFTLDGYAFNVIDLPGTYSITAYSPEELYVRDYIISHVPDVVLNVVDSTNLERNMYLTTQLIDMDIKVVIALNMYDEFQRNGDNLDYENLGKMIGVPIIPTIGSKGKGVKNLFRKIIEVYEDTDEVCRHIHINYGEILEKSIKLIQSKIKHLKNFSLTDHISSRFLSIKLIEKDKIAEEDINKCFNSEEIKTVTQKEISHLESEYKEDSETIFTDAKYGFIAGALKETLRPSIEKRRKKSDIIDTFITHKFWGIPIFIFFLWMTFYCTFNIGDYPMQWIESGVSALSGFLDKNLQESVLKDLFIDGIIGGVGGVIVFLPNIILLYLFISFMEDTGYMARAVFIMDKSMHKIGLHGKSFIPLIMGFGCNVPAILSTRIIESRRDRLITMLINPFISCSARLPVYILFISAFFSSNRGTVLFLIYSIGILMAILSALIFKKLMFKKEEIPFVMELPPYRMPTIRTVFKHMWFRTSQYLKKIGGVVLLASVIIWALGYFPRNVDFSEDYDKEIIKLEKNYNKAIVSISISDSSKATELNNLKNKDINNILAEQEIERQEKSYIGRIGKTIQPALGPLGFDWKMSVGILTGVAAKEVVIGTFGVLYNSGSKDGINENTLVKRLPEQKYTSGPKKGQNIFTPLVAFTFMLFILIYFPCVGVIAAIKKESGHWKWALFAIFYTTGWAWIVSFAVYQVGSLIL